MKTASHPAWLALACALGFAASHSQVLTAAGKPPFTWTTGLPEEVGLDSASLAEMFDYVKAHDVPVHSIQIVRHGRLVLDAYFYPFTADMRHDVASVTKSFTSTLLGLALQKGYLQDVRQPVLDLFPNRVIRKLDESKRRITLEDLLTMRAGWDCGFEPKEARLFEMRRSPDWLQFMLDLPMVAEPGAQFAYCSGNPHVLSIILSQATGMNAFEFARRELFEPLGISDTVWPADPQGHTHGWGDLQLHPRDMAKIGLLFLQRGRWEQRQLLAESWITNATNAHVDRTVNRDHYGYGWWVKGADFPGMFEAVGRGGQRINVWPTKELVIVFTGGGFEPGDLAGFLLKAIRSDGKLPLNPEAVAKLQSRLSAATNSPPHHLLHKAPALASRISGKRIKMSNNTLELQELRLTFNGSSEAAADLFIGAHHEHFAVGLDGVDRFSPDTLVNLPSACRGEWMNERAFVLRINLVGGINCYELKLDFSADSTRVKVHLSERTGLNEEQFEGVLSK